MLLYYHFCCHKSFASFFTRFRYATLRLEVCILKMLWIFACFAVVFSNSYFTFLLHSCLSFACHIACWSNETQDLLIRAPPVAFPRVDGKIKKIEMPEDLYVKVLQKASRFALPQCNQVSSYLNLSLFEHEYLYMSKNNDWTWKDIHFRRLSNNDWTRIQERVEQCLSSWKGKNLSNGGRLTLINSVLSSLPMYMMSFFEIPKGVQKKLDYFCSRFFWQSDEHKRRYRLAKWDILCQPKDQGGLGIHNLELKNIALLSTWLYRLLTTDSTWQQILHNKYLWTKPLV